MANFMDDCLSRCAKYNAQGEALVYGERRVSWAELNQRASQLAGALANLGVGKGDRVLFMFHNCPEFFETNYAIQKLGAIPVPMNYRFSPREIAFQANHCQAKVFLFEDVWLAGVMAARPDMPQVQHYVRKGRGGEQVLDYENLIINARLDYPRVDLGPDDVAVICYTGGTTGLPKGVMLTYQNHLGMLQALVRNIVSRLGALRIEGEMEQELRKQLPGFVISLINSSATRWLLSRTWLQRTIVRLADRAIGSDLAVRVGARSGIKAMMPSFPMFHDAAYQLAVLGPIMGNMTLLMPDKISFDPEYVLKMIEHERPVMLGNVPTAWRMLLDAPEIGHYDKSSVRVCATGAGVCPAALKRKIFEHFPGVVIADGFGQTEMTPVTSFRFDTSAATVKDHCVGKPIVETRIVDEAGQDVPAGEVGEIVYRGESVMKGYFDEPDKTAEAMIGGWFHSGDLGFFDADGDLRVVERKKECISSGGEKIFPHEVEEILLEHPKIADICVIGVADEKWGSTVRAVVQLKPDQNVEPQEVIAFCEGKMAGYKKPRSVVFVDKLPISPVGKVQRRQVKEVWGQPEAVAVAN